ncbi:MAG: DNA/RNA nuclease SfsA [Clostridiales bacterium]|jgi:sugar fermentation stimulation protein A|nr:DNA/RNA nuclease SfsA [Clostridiales bacterium]
MIYPNILPANFIARPNRFIAEVKIDGSPAFAHMKNTGRCRELLVPGAAIYLSKSDNPLRKTQYDLVAVQKGARLINIDSQAPNKVYFERLQAGRYVENITLIKPEAKYRQSRFDFYIEAGERKVFIEVKGVTLEENGVAMFPDAPTERGMKHLRELAASLQEGYEAQVVFVAQMDDVRYFAPNNATHAAFGEALREAGAAGVKVVALDCSIAPDSLTIGKEIEVRL